ncbi:Fungal specific transcription factor domain-containing protein [Cladophialophora immunda]|nr:Fungal specific transcription factor domain-containing protein [Cladophialophora immunda]
MSIQPDRQQAPDSGGSRNRSFNGCATCRIRHVKCDEGRPTCSMCKYFGLDCAGYEKGIFFDFETASNATGEGIARFRRPLLTEDERKRMSAWLVSSVHPKLTLRVLSQIDDECEHSAAQQQVQIQRGPFGAFSLSRLPWIRSNEKDTGEELLEQGSSTEDLVRLSDECVVSDDAPLSPWTQDLVQAIFSQSEQISVPASSDFWNTTVDSNCIQEIFDDQIPMSMSATQEVFSTPLSSETYHFPHFMPEAQLSQSMIIPSISPVISPGDTVPQDVVTLLKHYATTVITLLTPLRHTKTPWHILFIPHIRHCLAALTLGEQLDHASLTALYGTLAISAFSLGGVSQSPTWHDKGKAYKQRAREHARLMLRTAYAVPKTAKYKSILMALLAMVQLSMFVGTRDQTDCYLLEAEKFIRLKGLNRKKSRKVRLLHHCYVFERLFHESIFICGANSPQRQHVRKAIESSGLAIHSRDSLSFRLPTWTNLDEEWSIVKSQEAGENDLHLERPGEFPPTLYPEIFAFPEPWLLVLSLTIRLGKEKDYAEAEGGTDALSLKDFASRAKAVERRLYRLQRPTDTAHASSGLQSPRDWDVLNNMLDAVQQALIIYFNRRIHDLDASLLQQKVVGVRDCLLRCEIADPDVVHGSAGFLWPAFIAACEAEDPEVQVSFSHWFKISAQRSGLSCFTKTLQSIEQIWHEKQTSSGTSITWLDIMKQKTLMPHDL